MDHLTSAYTDRWSYIIMTTRLMKAEYHIGIRCYHCKLDVVFFWILWMWTVISDRLSAEAGGLSFQRCDSRFSVPYPTERPFLQLPHTGRTFVRAELSCVPPLQLLYIAEPPKRLSAQDVSWTHQGFLLSPRSFSQPIWSQRGTAVKK